MAAQKTLLKNCERCSMTDDALVGMSKTIVEHIKAGYPGLFIPTCEEARLESHLIMAAVSRGGMLVTWDVVAGFQPCIGFLIPAKSPLFGNQDLLDPLNALHALCNPKLWPKPIAADTDDPIILKARKIAKANAAARLAAGEPEEDSTVIVHFRDLDDYMEDNSARRMLRTLLEHNSINGANGRDDKCRRFLVISSNKRDLHIKLQPHLTVLEFELPSLDELRKIIAPLVDNRTLFGNPNALIPNDLKEKLARSLRGLTATEVENCVSRCLVHYRGWSPDMLDMVFVEKAAAVRRSEVLTLIPPTAAASDDIGGFDNFLAWLDRRKLAYTPEAEAAGLDYPKGVVLMGVPGTGKSLAAKVAARRLGVPGYVLDVGAIFDRFVGSSEQRLREALKQVEAQDGCVLLIDEADKALGKANESGGDGGVTQRIFGYLLTWLSEKKDRTFVILTLNRATGVPPELLRAGRFDALFWTDLPTENDRKDVLSIHLRKRGTQTAALLSEAEWEQLLEMTEGFVGAELESLVVDARYRAFESLGHGTPGIQQLCEAAVKIRPLSQRSEGEINAIREYCASRAEPVSLPPTPAASVTTSRRQIRL